MLVLHRPTVFCRPTEKKFLNSFSDRPTEISPDRKCFFKKKKGLKKFSRPTDRYFARPKMFFKKKKLLKSFPDRPTEILCAKLSNNPCIIRQYIHIKTAEYHVLFSKKKKRRKKTPSDRRLPEKVVEDKQTFFLLPYHDVRSRYILPQLSLLSVPSSVNKHR